MFLSFTITDPVGLLSLLLGFGILVIFLIVSFIIEVKTGGIDGKAFKWILIALFAGMFLSFHSPFGVLIEVAAIVVYVYYYKEAVWQREITAINEAEEREERKQKRLKEIGGTGLDRFYVECVLARCTDFSVPKNAEKARLFAQKYKQYPPCTTEELFMEAREKHGTIGDALRKERIAKLKEEEALAYRESMRYANYHGKEKMRIMLTHSIQALRRESDRIIDKAAGRSVTLEKESNWAAWGGFADGIAGPGAGLAMAMDVQQKNAQIRKRNSELLQTAMSYYAFVANDAAKLTRQADFEAEIRDSLDEKLLDDKTDPKDIFKQLKIYEEKITVSETGAFCVTAKVGLQNLDGPKIYGDVKARIDGTILARVYEDDKLVGTATLVLPKLGVWFAREPVIGICLGGSHPEKKQRIEFEAGNLWMIEC